MVTKTKTEKTQNINEEMVSRPPVVAVMGHVDHGKSTLLDYIRKTNVVLEEAGGITQKISAYEITYKDKTGQDKEIIFLDTPGHKAFTDMRARSAYVADIAVLVVAADDGVRPQTLEALAAIKKNEIPYIVAINKVDKEQANVEKTKTSLAEQEVYLEGYGGEIPYVEISAKNGSGVAELLELVTLTALLEGLEGDKAKLATGVILESNVDPKRGISATLIIKEGTLKKGMFITAGDATASVQIMENFLGTRIDEAFFSPVRITGFDILPRAGIIFQSFRTRKEAREAKTAFPPAPTQSKTPYLSRPPKLDETSQSESKAGSPTTASTVSSAAMLPATHLKILVPLIIKADTTGMVEAIEKEVTALGDEVIKFKVIYKHIGDPTEADVKLAIEPETIMIGLNVKTKENIQELCSKNKIKLKTFSVIYELTDWLKEELEKRKPKEKIDTTKGRAKVIRVFSKQRNKQVVGGVVLEGKIVLGQDIRILRKEFEIGQGKVRDLEKSRVKVKEVEKESEFGIIVESKTDIATGDILEQ